MKRTIGEFLAIQRKAKGLTQQEVADMLGISNKTLSSWESGRSYPDILTLPALAEIYGVTADEILNGERSTADRGADEISERSQRKLLKNAANRYSVKCTTLAGVGIGGIGLYVLALVLALFLGSAASWLILLFAILSVLSELTVVILFVVFEKSALLAEEETSRYSLTIKRMTYKAAFKIVCVACAFIVCSFCLFQLRMGGSMTSAAMVAILFGIMLAVLGLLILFIVWLSGRGREFYTTEEAAASSRNKKLAVKLLSIGGAIVIVLAITASVLSSINFTHTEKQIDCAEKNEFTRALQTIEISKNDVASYGISFEGDGNTCEYFVDIQAALSRPIDLSLGEKRGHIYHIEGNLYFRYTIDYDSNSRCYVLYSPDLTGQLEGYILYGTILFHEKAQFMQQYPSPTAEDLLLGMEHDEVFFLLNHNVTVVDPSAPDGFVNHHFISEYSIDLSDDRYVLILRETQNYPYISMIGAGGGIVTIIICLSIYAKKRTVIL